MNTAISYNDNYAFKTKKLVHHLTLREQILDTIRKQILRGKLKPGERVAEPELAEQFGISRTPIREAFRQLESEGYLTVVPRRGAVVASLSDRDVQEFYAIRSVLEGYAAELAAGHLSEKDLARLDTINQKLKRSAQTGNGKAFCQAYDEFHATFLKASDNSKLFELIQQLGMKFSSSRIAALIESGQMAFPEVDYDDVLEAFRRQDGKTAKSLVKQSAATVGTMLRKSLAPRQVD